MCHLDFKNVTNDKVVCYNCKGIKHRENNANLLTLYTDKAVNLAYWMAAGAVLRIFSANNGLDKKVRSREYYSVSYIGKTSSYKLANWW